MKSSFLLLLSSFILAVSACGPSFEHSPGNIKYRYIVHNEKGKKPQIGDVLSLNIRIEAEDSVILNNQLFFNLDSVRYNECDIHEGLALLASGDSVEMRMNTKLFYQNSFHTKMPERFDPDGEVILHIRLFSFVGKQKIDRERQAYSNQSKLDEQKELDDYLSENQINAEAKDGIYVTITQNGAGAPLRNEQKVTVNYTGKFLSGQIFDSSYDRNEAYTFTLGVGEVIPAWDNGLKNAHIGDKLQIISPSAQAYGAEGSEGYIPPFTTLLFEIEILDAK